jgi:hypothetical protein
MPPLGMFIGFAHVPQWDMHRMLLQGTLPPLERLCPVAQSILRIMADDDERRKDGTFQQYWDSVIPPEVWPVVGL